MSSESSSGSYLGSSASCSSPTESTQRIFMNTVDQPVPETGPYIEILEQPQSHTRFRYSSEGDHGYLYGENTNKLQTTYPTVQLMNYKDNAYIRCQLYQFDKEEEHPHQLKFHGQDSQIGYSVPFNGSYIVYFENLSFVTKSINSVRQALCMQYVETHPYARAKEVNKECKKILKSINFNKLRLRFSAHNIKTDELICHTFSRPISNSKNAETNELRIVRGINLFGNAGGGKETTLLVEKTNKNIKVRFVEPESGWWEMAHIVYRHHQFALVCRVPAYKDKKIAHDVKVFIELVREKDGATSNRMPFTYRGRPYLRMNNHRRTFTLPVSHAIPVEDNLHHNGDIMETPAEIKKSPNDSYENLQNCEVQWSQERWFPVVPIARPQTPQQHTLHNAPFLETQIHSNTDSRSQENRNDLSINLENNIIIEDSPFESLPFLSTPKEVTTSLTSELMLEGDDDGYVLRSDPVLGEAASIFSFTACPFSAQTDEMEKFNEHYQSLDLPEYYGQDNIPNETLFQGELSADSAPTFSFQQCSLRRKPPKDSDKQILNFSNSKSLKIKESFVKQKRYLTLGELLKIEKIKKLVMEIIILIKRNGSQSDLQTKLQQLFDLNLPNGDTFLHIAMNRPIFFVLVETLRAVNIAYLLNKANDLYQTVLHIAVINELPDVVQMLISKGCDPMLADADGNNAIHLAVTSYPTLVALFDAMAACKVAFDVNATNYDNETPLHLAIINDCDTSLRLLLKKGADIRARDHCGRTALQLAAGHDRAKAMSVLLYNLDSADPLKREGNTVSAMKLARRHPEMCKNIHRHGYKARLQDSDDEYHTADEGEHEDDIASKLQSLNVNDFNVIEGTIH